MPTAPELIDPFHRSLHARLTVLLEERIMGLANGSASRHDSDVASVAEKYAAQVAYISAITAVLELCEELEQERYGTKKKDQDNQE